MNRHIKISFDTYFIIFLVITMLFGPFIFEALGEPVTLPITQDTDLGGTAGEKITSQPLNATQSYPAAATRMRTNGVRAVAFDIVYVDTNANGSTTAINMTCTGGRQQTIAGSASFNTTGGSTVCSGTPLACLTTTANHTWSHPVTGSTTYTWIQTNIPWPYMQCQFTGSGAPEVDDLITVFGRGIYP